ncbi:diguanylate cyclase [Parahaliea mediterranea]|uniref:diguanylate cyclase n=1 Tax=Parahaliea mediterranea TaxID=651086 RepID=A0A939DEE2_9GAMM|nr:diguanylate cyclase [Parahaliea mediterranea]
MINYLLASLVVISAVLSGACFLGYRLFERPRHALMWALTFALVALQYSVNLLRDYIPTEAVFWQSANMLAFAASLFALWGHRDRLGLETRRRRLTLAFLVLSLLSAVFVYWYPTLGLRAAIAPAFTFLAMTHIAVILVREGKEPRLAQAVAAVVHLLFGLTQGLAAAIALRLGQGPEPELVKLYSAVNFAFMPTLFIALGISAIFLLATDLSQRLGTMALRDVLTGLYNRRGFLAATESLWARCRRKEQPLSLMLVDIDYFKRINDRYGHSFGDRALQHFAQILRDSIRAEDALGRIGGEEFAVTLGEMTSGEAERVANRIRDLLATRRLVCGRHEVFLKASFGIAQWEEKDDIAILIKRADIALYEAKASGRDAIMISGRRGLVGMASNG